MLVKLAIFHDGLNVLALAQQARHVCQRISIDQQQVGNGPGAIADLLLVDGNPLTDMSCLLGQGEHIQAIMKDGKFYKHI